MSPLAGFSPVLWRGYARIDDPNGAVSRLFGGGRGGVYPTVEQSLMRFDPAVGLAFNIRFLRFALVHPRVLRVDIGNRQLHDGEELGRCRIGFGPLFVGDDAHAIDGEAIVCAVGQLGADPFLLTR